MLGGDDLSRVRSLVELYNKAVQEYTKNPEEWKGLLSAIARYYKRSFDNAVLVYAQRPDFTQLATFDEWHDKRINRSINKGAKGIAVIDMSNPNASFKYLFDLMDTNGTPDSFRAVVKFQWELEEQYYSDIISKFHQLYNTPISDIESCLHHYVIQKVLERLPNLDNMQISDQESILYDMPIEAVRAEISNLIAESVLYTIFYKCGLSTESLEYEAMKNISHYNSLELFMALGNATVSISRPILKEIYQEIENVKRERSGIYENRAVNESTVSREQRSDAAEYSNLGESEHGQPASREVRETVERIHDGETFAPSVSADSGGENQRDDSTGGRRSGGGERETNSEPAGSTADAGRGADHGADTAHESDHHAGRGNSDGRSSNENQVKPKPNREERKPSVDALKPSIDGFFSVPPKIPEPRQLEPAIAMKEAEFSELINAVLCADDIVLEAKSWQHEIGRLFQMNASHDEIEHFIQYSYGTLDVDYEIVGIEIDVSGDGEGLNLVVDQQSVHLSYNELVQRVESLVLDGIYPSAFIEQIDDFQIPDELEQMPSMSDQQRWESDNGENYETAQFSLFDGSVQDDSEQESDVYEDKSDVGSDSMVEPDRIEQGQEEQVEEQEEPPKKEYKTKSVTFTGQKENHLNYRFSEDHNLYTGGAKTKCKNNIAAIELLKQLQEENRMATPEEQIVLARYVGWGGLANALTPGKSGWETEYAEIKALLTDEEFESAQHSTTTAYYTEQMIVEQMYAALDKFGFSGGNILDPAMATGNFYSVLPDSMQISNLYGVELDRVSGHIAKQLYPGADIQIKGYEDCNYPDHFFDVIIGNFPFNSIRVNDRRYDRHRFKIHDYFLAKSLDKARPGGIVAAITSKYTLDKANPTIRKYLAQRAELIGAIRLPNTAFKSLAGTEVTSDILFLKKREREIVPDEVNSPWISIETNEDGIPLNSYFIEHPEMVLGKMVFDESMFGNEKTTACHPDPEDNLKERLERAIFYLDGTYEPAISEYAEEETVLDESLPASPDVRNFSYTVIDDTIYFQEHSRMYQQDITGIKAERIKGLVELAGVVRDLIAFQSDPYYFEQELPTTEYDVELQNRIDKLNHVYDKFAGKYGSINSRANVMAFSRDSNAPLLRSIEKEQKNQKGVFEKTAMFYRATIKPKVMPKAVFSAEDALKASLNHKGTLDLDYMSWLYQKPEQRKATKDEVIEELGDKIFQDPSEYSGDLYSGWQTAEEYLSGYVKDKLEEAILMAKEEPERFSRNVEALKRVQPTPLTPAEISFTMGSTWIPLMIYTSFMYETFKTPVTHRHGSHSIDIDFSKFNGTYHISNKSVDKNSIPVYQTYGTKRINAYEIMENSLNLRSVEVKDPVEYVDPETGEDKVRYVLNKKETILAREKQAQMKMQFESWLFSEPKRGALLTKRYNERFNNIRPRVYNGDDLELPDMNEEIKLRKHQRDVVAMGIYSSGNLLAAHEVGAGKTYSAIVIAYELKRLGKVNKPIFAVPNHLVGQWAEAYMKLYPHANILVAEKKDFERKSRRRFASRIATGDYDAVIMAHSSFELIGLSRERQLSAMQTEINAVTEAIQDEKFRDKKSWSLKQMQVFRSNLQFRYDKLFNADKKDDVINFEELGVDCLVVDESHAYKNNFSFTKMRNVAGVSGQSSQRAMDMHQKAQYINEIGNDKGVIYLTGTPISNSMAELYVIQKTLQPKALEERGLLMFDSWASTFGKVETSLEIKPEGNGYQMKNRFAKFHNIPELMSIFSMIADIKTADMLDLPVPELKTGNVQVIKTKITPEQKQMVLELGERAEAIRDGRVDSTEDNFLKLTHEARLLAVDPRAIDPDLPDDPGTKLNVCAAKVAEIYHETANDKLTQLIFCDQGTPKADGSFNFYQATMDALIDQGVKEEEIAFIHEAKTDGQRERLFEQVKSGDIRVLIGSTEKMGTGMNVQNKLIALHHLDVPWRPSDLIQRNGRILRQGNENKEVSIFNYITENTFDSYLWVRHEVA